MKPSSCAPASPHRPRRARWAAGACAALLAACANLLPPSQTTLEGRVLIYTRGGQGAPVVVLQSGLGDDRLPWAAVQHALQAHYTVLSYDRPGYGGSAGVAGARDACTVATELHALLATLGLQPPYILVGHSLGGLYQHAYARLYPQDVAGLVLLDPTHPQHWAAMKADVPAAATAIKVLRSTVFNAAARREFDDQAGCLERLQGAPAPGAQTVPTRLLASTRFSAVEGADFQKMLERLRDDWLLMTAARTWQRVPDAGHYIQRDAPDAVVRAVQSLTPAR